MPQSMLALVPQLEESLSIYVRRLRHSLNLTQEQVSQAAGIHRQTIGKIESGLSTRLNQRAKNGLSYALGIPTEYLDAVCKGVPVVAAGSLKFCPRCWVPGTAPDPIWMDIRSKYCFICSTALCSRCSQCSEPITSLRFRYCPYCGTPYKPLSTTVNRSSKVASASGGAINAS